MSADKMRDAFEREFAGPQCMMLRRVISDERYESMETQWAYRAWHEAKVTQAAEIARLTQELADIKQRAFYAGLDLGLAHSPEPVQAQGVLTEGDAND